MKKVTAILMFVALALPVGLMAQGGSGSKGDKIAQTETAKPAKKGKDEKGKQASSKGSKSDEKKPADEKPKK